MISDFKFKQKYDFGDFVGIVAILRSPVGCPWDREQTHKSIRRNFIEETYEAVEAIDTDDPVLLQEELGDVLLQVGLHSQMEKEKGTFDISDVIDGVCKKLIIRHPHVFGNEKADTTEQVLASWDEIKKRQKGQTTQSEAMESVSRALPALMRSCKVQQKAAKSGFGWKDVPAVLRKVREETDELEKAVKSGDEAAKQEELGDLLFSAVNVSRFLDIEPEEALTRACDKFLKRFAYMEKQALNSGRKIGQLDGRNMNRLWNEAKKAL